MPCDVRKLICISNCIPQRCILEPRLHILFNGEGSQLPDSGSVPECHTAGPCTYEIIQWTSSKHLLCARTCSRHPSAPHPGGCRYKCELLLKLVGPESVFPKTAIIPLCVYSFNKYLLISQGPGIVLGTWSQWRPAFSSYFPLNFKTCQEGIWGISVSSMSSVLSINHSTKQINNQQLLGQITEHGGHLEPGPTWCPYSNF